LTVDPTPFILRPPYPAAISSDKYPQGMPQLIAAWSDATGPPGMSPADALERERRGDPIPLVNPSL